MEILTPECYSAWGFKTVRQDILVGEKDKLAGPYLIPEGTYAHVAHELHHTNPKRFQHPEKWTIERHIKWETRPGTDEKVADTDPAWHLVRPISTLGISIISIQQS